MCALNNTSLPSYRAFANSSCEVLVWLDIRELKSKLVMNQSWDSPHILKRYPSHLPHVLFPLANKSELALLVLGPTLAPPPCLRLCLYSIATCSNTSTSNMFTSNFGFILSLTKANGSWSLGLNPSNSLNNRQLNRLVATLCFLSIRALSGTSAFCDCRKLLQLNHKN